MSEHESGKSFAAGLLLGALVGAGVTLLFAPQSGEDTRRLIRRRAKRLASDARDRYDDLVDKAQRVKKRAQDAIAD